MSGAHETDRLPQEAYRPEVTRRVYRVLCSRAARAVAAGHSAIVDAVFDLAEERIGITELAAKAGVEFRGLFLTTDLQTRIRRIGKRVGDPSDADAAVATQQESLPLGAVEWTKLDASGLASQTLEQARALIG
jgi:predicted kinase